jgi:ubiquinone/menaquinone biosynthesis C-methylase UbiE
MLPEILPHMRCPGCFSIEWRGAEGGLSCMECGAQYPMREGILDFLGDTRGEIITPFQRLMQTPSIVFIYEKSWRRIGYYLASSRAFNCEMQTVLRHGEAKQPSRTLDLACGTGVFTRPLARRASKLVVGLDLSRPMLRHAQRLAEKDAIRNILFLRATAFSMPFADASFPYVNCCGALHLFDRPDSALKEIRRILRPGGHLCVQTTIRPNRSAGLAYFLEKFIRFGFFNEDQLRKKMDDHGFRILESERHRISFTFLARRET